jgi:uncharacterized membrane protein
MTTDRDQDGVGESGILGPVQIMVIGFEGDRFTGDILPEIKRLQNEDVIRLIDLLVVEKDVDGDLRARELWGVGEEERGRFGETVEALVGFGAEGGPGLEQGPMAGAVAMQNGVFDARDIWAVADAIPKETSAAIALLEHRWAIPLRDAVVRAGGTALADEWLHPLDLIAAGVQMSEKAPHQRNRP